MEGTGQAPRARADGEVSRARPSPGSFPLVRGTPGKPSRLARGRHTQSLPLNSIRTQQEQLLGVRHSPRKRMSFPPQGSGATHRRGSRVDPGLKGGLAPWPVAMDTDCTHHKALTEGSSVSTFQGAGGRPVRGQGDRQPGSVPAFFRCSGKITWQIQALSPQPSPRPQPGTQAPPPPFQGPHPLRSLGCKSNTYRTKVWGGVVVLSRRSLYLVLLGQAGTELAGCVSRTGCDLRPLLRTGALGAGRTDGLLMTPGVGRSAWVHPHGTQSLVVWALLRLGS